MFKIKYIQLHRYWPGAAIIAFEEEEEGTGSLEHLNIGSNGNT